MTIYTHTERETETAGEALAARLGQNAVVTLYGPLGAGKTAFVRGLAKGLGIDAQVSSPTFTIVNEYPGRRTLYHFDLYRLQSAEELFGIGWDDYLDQGGILAVEWSEHATGVFDGSEIVVRIQPVDDETRRIEIEEVNLC